jgi:carboxylate-amine ligase
MGTHVTLGLKEEYLLPDEGRGLLAARVAEVRAGADQETVMGGGEVDSELLQAQVDVATPVCTGLDEVTARLARFRQALAVTARRAHCPVSPRPARRPCRPWDRRCR